MRIGLALYDSDSVAAEATLAEKLGFDYVAAGEHLFFHGPTPNAFVMLAAAAGATHSIRLLSSIVLAPLYPAALCAKMASIVDRVSGGRFELGLGAGGEFPEEFTAVGVDPATRFRRLDESLAVITQLFRQRPTSFDGEYTRFRRLSLNPPPVQASGPPIWLAGRHAGGIARAGRFADVWMPYMVTPDRFRDGLRAVRDSAEAAGRPRDAVDGAIYLWACVDEDGDWARKSGIANVSEAYSQDFSSLADRYLLLGTPEEASERLRQYSLAGATRAIISIAADRQHHCRLIHTLAESILPLRTALSA